MRVILTLLLAVTLATAVAEGAVVPLGATLGPIPGGSGTGVFGMLDDVNMTLDVHVTFSGLSTPTTGGEDPGPDPPAHIHEPDGPVIIPFVGFPTNATSGTYTMLLTDLSEMQVEDLLAGALARSGYYVNIHTTAYPGGEIRGDIYVVPEPATVLILGSGLAALALLRARKKAA